MAELRKPQAVKREQSAQSAPQASPSLKELKDAIPKSCFESSVVTSMSYLACDIVYAIGLTYAALHIRLIPSQLLRFLAWALYGFLQGCVGTGLWVLAHECGHGAFSKHAKLNDFVGWVVHSSLLVPYFSWKITHARHHRYTNHLEKDPVFVPWTDTELAKKRKFGLEQLKSQTEETPIAVLLKLIVHQLTGWQFYLLWNVSAGKKSGPDGELQKTLTYSHFDPLSALFRPSQRTYVVLSDLGLIIMGSILYYAATQIGWANVGLLYFVPYFWVHHWLIAITYLHHTHPVVPHYTAEAWSYTKGALATVDRTAGFIGRHFFHNIIDYHVVHHMFSRIPFYKAKEATNAIKPLLGESYRERKDESFFYSLLTTFQKCIYVSETSHAQEYSAGVLHWVVADDI